MCMNDDARSADLSSSSLGEMEQEWLYLARLFCMGYEHNRTEYWDRAIGHAEMRYGVDNGPAVAARLAAVIRAMRVERLGGFAYLSPFCPSCRQGITEDEWHLIALMRAGYQGESGTLTEAAAEFAGRTTAPALEAAASRFGSLIAKAVGSHRRAPSRSMALH